MTVFSVAVWIDCDTFNYHRNMLMKYEDCCPIFEIVRLICSSVEDSELCCQCFSLSFLNCLEFHKYCSFSEQRFTLASEFLRLPRLICTLIRSVRTALLKSPWTLLRFHFSGWFFVFHLAVLEYRMRRGLRWDIINKNCFFKWWHRW